MLYRLNYPSSECDSSQFNWQFLLKIKPKSQRGTGLLADTNIKVKTWQCVVWPSVSYSSIFGTLDTKQSSIRHVWRSNERLSLVYFWCLIPVTIVGLQRLIFSADSTSRNVVLAFWLKSPLWLAVQNGEYVHEESVFIVFENPPQTQRRRS